METATSNPFHIYSPKELKNRSVELRSGEYLIDGLIPRQSISLVVGKSGEGKSPFLYQAMISVAAGIPLLGRPVKQGKVLYLDCENGLAQVDTLLQRISGHLGLNEPPPNLRLWNLNDAGENFGKDGHELADFIRIERPDWVIIDPLKTIFPGIDKENALANKCYRDLRKLGAEFQCTFTGVHHPKKTSSKPEERPEKLEIADDLREWFSQSRGSQELINGCDIRIGIDEATTAGAAIVVRGFGRVDGEFPMMLLARENGEDGKPVGYRLMQGLDQLADHQLKTFRKLPPVFRFTEAMKIYGRTDNPTNKFLDKLVTLGLIEHDKPNQIYSKVEGGRGVVVLPMPRTVGFKAA